MLSNDEVMLIQISAQLDQMSSFKELKNRRICMLSSGFRHRHRHRHHHHRREMGSKSSQPWLPIGRGTRQRPRLNAPFIPSLLLNVYCTYNNELLVLEEFNKERLLHTSRLGLGLGLGEARALQLVLSKLRMVFFIYILGEYCSHRVNVVFAPLPPLLLPTLAYPKSVLFYSPKLFIMKQIKQH
jgi:hypothetical protein